MRNMLTIATVTSIFLVSFQAKANTDNTDVNGGDPSLLQICPEEPISQSVANTDLLDPGCGGDPGDGGGGGPGENPPPPPPFSPPLMSYPQQLLPAILTNPFAYAQCRQFPHAFVAFSNDVQQGATLYLSGIVAPNTFAVFGFYNQFGQLAKVKMTNDSKSNCVIHHDENPVSTSDLAPGYYSVFASYNTLSPPGALPIFGGSFPPNFNYIVTVNGYQNSVSMRYVTTIRIR